MFSGLNRQFLERGEEVSPASSSPTRATPPLVDSDIFLNRSPAIAAGATTVSRSPSSGRGDGSIGPVNNGQYDTPPNEQQRGKEENFESGMIFSSNMNDGDSMMMMMPSAAQHPQTNALLFSLFHTSASLGKNVTRSVSTSPSVSDTIGAGAIRSAVWPIATHSKEKGPVQHTSTSTSTSSSSRSSVLSTTSASGSPHTATTNRRNTTASHSDDTMTSVLSFSSSPAGHRMASLSHHHHHHHHHHGGSDHHDHHAPIPSPFAFTALRDSSSSSSLLPPGLQRIHSREGAAAPCAPYASSAPAPVVVGQAEDTTVPSGFGDAKSMSSEIIQKTKLGTKGATHPISAAAAVGEADAEAPRYGGIPAQRQSNRLVENNSKNHNMNEEEDLRTCAYPHTHDHHHRHRQRGRAPVLRHPDAGDPTLAAGSRATRGDHFSCSTSASSYSSAPSLSSPLNSSSRTSGHASIGQRSEHATEAPQATTAAAPKPLPVPTQQRVQGNAVKDSAFSVVNVKNVHVPQDDAEVVFDAMGATAATTTAGGGSFLPPPPPTSSASDWLHSLEDRTRTVNDSTSTTSASGNDGVALLAASLLSVSPISFPRAYGREPHPPHPQTDITTDSSCAPPPPQQKRPTGTQQQQQQQSKKATNGATEDDDDDKEEETRRVSHKEGAIDASEDESIPADLLLHPSIIAFSPGFSTTTANSMLSPTTSMSTTAVTNGLDRMVMKHHQHHHHHDTDDLFTADRGRCDSPVILSASETAAIAPALYQWTRKVNHRKRRSDSAGRRRAQHATYDNSINDDGPEENEESTPAIRINDLPPRSMPMPSSAGEQSPRRTMREREEQEVRDENNRSGKVIADTTIADDTPTDAPLAPRTRTTVRREDLTASARVRRSQTDGCTQISEETMTARATRRNLPPPPNSDTAKRREGNIHHMMAPGLCLHTDDNNVHESTFPRSSSAPFLSFMPSSSSSSSAAASTVRRATTTTTGSGKGADHRELLAAYLLRRMQAARQPLLRPPSPHFPPSTRLAMSPREEDGLGMTTAAGAAGAGAIPIMKTTTTTTTSTTNTSYTEDRGGEEDEEQRQWKRVPEASSVWLSMMKHLSHKVHPPPADDDLVDGTPTDADGFRTPYQLEAAEASQRHHPDLLQQRSIMINNKNNKNTTTTTTNNNDNNDNSMRRMGLKSTKKHAVSGITFDSEAQQKGKEWATPPTMLSSPSPSTWLHTDTRVSTPPRLFIPSVCTNDLQRPDDAAVRDGPHARPQLHHLDVVDERLGGMVTADANASCTTASSVYAHTPIIRITAKQHVTRRLDGLGEAGNAVWNHASSSMTTASTTTTSTSYALPKPQYCVPQRHGSGIKTTTVAGLEASHSSLHSCSCSNSDACTCSCHSVSCHGGVGGIGGLARRNRALSSESPSHQWQDGVSFRSELNTNTNNDDTTDFCVRRPMDHTDSAFSSPSLPVLHGVSMDIPMTQSQQRRYTQDQDDHHTLAAAASEPRDRTAQWDDSDNAAESASQEEKIDGHSAAGDAHDERGQSDACRSLHCQPTTVTLLGEPGVTDPLAPPPPPFSIPASGGCDCACHLGYDYRDHHHHQQGGGVYAIFCEASSTEGGSFTCSLCRCSTCDGSLVSSWSSSSSSLSSDRHHHRGGGHGRHASGSRKRRDTKKRNAERILKRKKQKEEEEEKGGERREDQREANKIGAFLQSEAIAREEWWRRAQNAQDAAAASQLAVMRATVTQLMEDTAIHCSRTVGWLTVMRELIVEEASERHRLDMEAALEIQSMIAGFHQDEQQRRWLLLDPLMKATVDGVTALREQRAAASAALGDATQTLLLTSSKLEGGQPRGTTNDGNGAPPVSGAPLSPSPAEGANQPASSNAPNTQSLHRRTATTTTTIALTENRSTSPIITAAAVEPPAASALSPVCCHRGTSPPPPLSASILVEHIAAAVLHLTTEEAHARDALWEEQERLWSMALGWSHALRQSAVDGVAAKEALAAVRREAASVQEALESTLWARALREMEDAEGYARVEWEALEASSRGRLVVACREGVRLLERQQNRLETCIRRVTEERDVAMEEARDREAKLRYALSLPTVILAPSPLENMDAAFGGQDPAAARAELDLPVHRRFARAHQEALKATRAQRRCC